MAGARKGRSPKATRDAREVPSEATGAVGSAAGLYVRMTNVAHKPERDVTEADCEKLLDWLDRRWGKVPRDAHEANRWWVQFWSCSREQLAFACAELKNGQRPTRLTILAKCFEYRPPKQEELC